MFSTPSMVRSPVLGGATASRRVLGGSTLSNIFPMMFPIMVSTPSCHAVEQRRILGVCAFGRSVSVGWSSCDRAFVDGLRSSWRPLDDLLFFWGCFDAYGELGIARDEESVSTRGRDEPSLEFWIEVEGVCDG